MSRPIALVLGTDEFVAAQRRRGTIEWVACRGGILDDAGLRRVSEMLERSGMRGRTVRLAPFESASVTQLMELPPRSSGAPVDELAAAELARIMRGSKGELTARAIEVPPPARRGTLTWYLAAGVVSAEAGCLAEALSRIGLRVEHIEPRAAALGAAFAGLLAGAGVRAGMEVGSVQSRFVALVDGMLAYERVIPIGWLSEPAAALAGNRTISARGAATLIRGAMRAPTAAWAPDVRGAIEGAATGLAREFAVSAAYVLERYRADALAEACVVAPGALGLAGLLSTTMEMPVREAAWNVTPAEASPGLGAAIGLLSRTGTGCLPPALANRRALRRRVVQASWAAGASGVLAGAGVLSVTLVPEQSVAALASQVRVSDETTDAMSAEVAESRAALARGVQSLRAARAAQDRVNWTPLLVSLGELAGEDVRLTQVSLSPVDKGARVSVRGAARDQAALSRFVLAMEGTGAFVRVDLQESSASRSGSDSQLSFSLSALLGEGAR